MPLSAGTDVTTLTQVTASTVNMAVTGSAPIIAQTASIAIAGSASFFMTGTLDQGHSGTERWPVDTGTLGTVTVTSTLAAPLWVTGSTGGSAEVAVTSSVPIQILVTGALPVSTGTFPTVTVLTGAFPTINVLTGTMPVVVVTSSLASPVWVSSSQATGITGTVTVTSSQAAPVWMTGTVTFTASVLPVTSSQASPVWVTSSTATGITGTVTVTSSQANPVWVSSTQATGITGTVVVTSSVANPVVVTGAVAITSTQANPLWMTGTVSFTASTLMVTSSQAAPVWVSSTQATGITGTVVVTSTQAAPLWVTGSTGGSANVNVTGSVPITATFTGTVPVSSSAGAIGIFGGYADPNNSTVIPLGANASFTGTATNFLNYGAVYIHVQTDQISAVGGITYEVSNDGVNWGDPTIKSYAAVDVAAPGNSYEFMAKGGSFYRVRYQNGAVSQSFFRMQTTPKQGLQIAAASDMQGVLNGTEHALVTRAQLIGKVTTGAGSGTYTDVRVTNGGNLAIANTAVVTPGAAVADVGVVGVAQAGNGVAVSGTAGSMNVHLDAQVVTVTASSATPAYVQVTGALPVATHAVTQGGAFATLVSGTVTVTASSASPAYVAFTGSLPIGTLTVTASSASPAYVAFTGSAPVNTGTMPVVVVTSSVANPLIITGTVGFSASVMAVTSSIANPVWISSSTGLGVTGTVVVTSSQANPVWVSLSGGSNVNISSSVPLQITSSQTNPAWVAISGGPIFTATFTGSLPMPTVTVQSDVGNPVWVQVTGGLPVNTGTFPTVLTVTATQANPAWVTGTIVSQVGFPTGTLTVTATQANPVWITSSGGGANVSVVNSPVVTATFTGSVPVNTGTMPVVVVTSAVGSPVYVQVTGAVPVSTGVFPTVTVTSPTALPVFISSSVGLSINGPVTVTSSVAAPVTITGNVFFSSSAMVVSGTTTPTDAFANPTTAVSTVAHQMTWNGTSWDRQQSVLGGALVTVQGNYGSTGSVANGPANSWLIFDSGRAGVSLDKTLFYDQASGTSINALLWTTGTSGTTSAVTVANGAITLSGSAISGTFSSIQSIPLISMVGRYPWRISSLIATSGTTINNFVPTGSRFEFGWMQTGSTNFTEPVDGAYFRWFHNAAGTQQVIGVVANGGTEFTTPTFASMSDGGYHHFEIVPFQDRCRFFIDGVQQVVDPGNTAAMIVSIAKLPLIARAFTTGVLAPSVAPVAKIGEVFVLQAGAAQDSTPFEQVLAKGLGSDVNPSTYAQAQTGSNSNAPTLAVLSNTAASYTSLGGTWRISGTTGAVTDYAFFAYQQPAMHDFVITGIDVTAYTNGTVPFSASVLQWTLGLNSTAASLATTDALPNVVGTRRTLIGAMTFASSSFAGGQGPTNGRCSMDLTMSPLVCRANRFLHIILRIPVGTNAANTLMDGGVTIHGYNRS